MQTMEKHTLLENSIACGIGYPEYLAMVAKLVAEGKSSSPTPSEEMSVYTKLNYKRMLRLDKTIRIDGKYAEIIKSYTRKVTWLVLTESWCGDAAQIIPIINKVALLNDNITLKIIFRDQNIDVMDLCLTNGTRSIPKLLVLDENYDIVNSFGPRPEAAVRLVDDYREQYGKLTPDFKQYLQLWYNKDRGKNTIKDLLQLMV